MSRTAVIHTPVLDATGIDGAYDFTLSFSAIGILQGGGVPGAPAPPGGAAAASDPNGALSLLDAVTKQLGGEAREANAPDIRPRHRSRGGEADRQLTIARSATIWLNRLVRSRFACRFARDPATQACERQGGANFLRQASMGRTTLSNSIWRQCVVSLARHLSSHSTLQCPPASFAATSASVPPRPNFMHQYRTS